MEKKRLVGTIVPWLLSFTFLILFSSCSNKQQTIIGTLEIPAKHSLKGIHLKIADSKSIGVHPEAVEHIADIYKYNGRTERGRCGSADRGGSGEAQFVSDFGVVFLDVGLQCRFFQEVHFGVFQPCSELNKVP